MIFRGWTSISFHSASMVCERGRLKRLITAHYFSLDGWVAHVRKGERGLNEQPPSGSSYC